VPLLDVERLSAGYGRLDAVQDVSLTVAEGEVVAVLGANGAGKSTLLKTILGLLPARSGRVRLGGDDVTRAGPTERVARGIVLVPEGRRIVMGLSVEENLLMGAWARNDRAAVRTEIDAVYQRFPNLAERRRMRGSVLSGGEQQMLAIGRGLLARPRLLMLDEPSLGLSPRLVGELFRLLVDLNREGLTILLVEQNTRKALEIARRAYVMELGKFVLEGPPGELVSDDRLREAYLGAATSSRTAYSATAGAGAHAGQGLTARALTHGPPGDRRGP
jgi:branched-chain amino acid transport system ATP-binding protein